MVIRTHGGWSLRRGEGVPGAPGFAGLDAGLGCESVIAASLGQVMAGNLGAKASKLLPNRGPRSYDQRVPA